jgi:hypothetical protein
MLPEHPLYNNEELVKQATEWHLKEGRTVFQLWMTDPDERVHSLRVKRLVGIPHESLIASLGCGVGGMEAYWKQDDPTLKFLLVNQSQVQLELCKCPGVGLHCKAEDFKYLVPTTCVVAAYMLGHVKDKHELLTKAQKSSRIVVVLDVFDTTPEFKNTLWYDAPTTELMRELGFKQIVPEDGWWLTDFVQDEPVIAASTPGLWVWRG